MICFAEKRKKGEEQVKQYKRIALGRMNSNNLHCYHVVIKFYLLSQNNLMCLFYRVYLEF